MLPLPTLKSPVSKPVTFSSNVTTNSIEEAFVGLLGMTVIVAVGSVWSLLIENVPDSLPLPAESVAPLPSTVTEMSPSPVADKSNE